MSPWSVGKKKKSKGDVADQIISTPNQQLARTAVPNSESNEATELSQSRTRPVFEIDPTEGEYHLKILHDPEEAVVEYVLLKLLSPKELTTV